MVEGVDGEQEWPSRKNRSNFWDNFADEHCNQAALDFLSTTDVGRPALAEEEVGSEVSEWEGREREKGRRAKAEELGAMEELGGGAALPLFRTAPSLMTSAGEEKYEWEALLLCTISFRARVTSFFPL